MPKVKINRPASYNHQSELTIRVGDLNYGAHLGYDRVLSLAHQVRVELFDSWGVTEIDLGDGQTGLVVGDVAVNYLGEGFLNDRLVVKTQPMEVGAIAFRLGHLFINKKTGQEIGVAEIGFVGFNYKSRMPGRLPASFVSKLNELANNGPS